MKKSIAILALMTTVVVLIILFTQNKPANTEDLSDHANEVKEISTSDPVGDNNDSDEVKEISEDSLDDPEKVIDGDTAEVDMRSCFSGMKLKDVNLSKDQIKKTLISNFLGDKYRTRFLWRNIHLEESSGDILILNLANVQGGKRLRIFQEKEGAELPTRISTDDDELVNPTESQLNEYYQRGNSIHDETFSSLENDNGSIVIGEEREGGIFEFKITGRDAFFECENEEGKLHCRCMK